MACPGLPPAPLHAKVGVPSRGSWAPPTLPVESCCVFFFFSGFVLQFNPRRQMALFYGLRWPDPPPNRPALAIAIPTLSFLSSFPQSCSISCSRLLPRHTNLLLLLRLRHLRLSVCSPGSRGVFRLAMADHGTRKKKSKSSQPRNCIGKIYLPVRKIGMPIGDIVRGGCWRVCVCVLACVGGGTCELGR